MKGIVGLLQIVRRALRYLYVYVYFRMCSPNACIYTRIYMCTFIIMTSASLFSLTLISLTIALPYSLNHIQLRRKGGPALIKQARSHPPDLSRAAHAIDRLIQTGRGTNAGVGAGVGAGAHPSSSSTSAAAAVGVRGSEGSESEPSAPTMEDLIALPVRG